MTFTQPAKRTRSPHPIRCTRRSWCAMDYILGAIIAVGFAHIVPQVIAHMIAGAR
jgi:hypothetical protein